MFSKVIIKADHLDLIHKFKFWNPMLNIKSKNVFIDSIIV